MPVLALERGGRRVAGAEAPAPQRWVALVAVCHGLRPVVVAPEPSRLRGFGAFAAASQLRKPTASQARRVSRGGVIPASGIGVLRARKPASPAAGVLVVVVLVV